MESRYSSSVLWRLTSESYTSADTVPAVGGRADRTKTRRNRRTLIVTGHLRVRFLWYPDSVLILHNNQKRSRGKKNTHARGRQDSVQTVHGRTAPCLFSPCPHSDSPGLHQRKKGRDLRDADLLRQKGILDTAPLSLSARKSLPAGFSRLRPQSTCPRSALWTGRPLFRVPCSGQRSRSLPGQRLRGRCQGH